MDMSFGWGLKRTFIRTLNVTEVKFVEEAMFIMVTIGYNIGTSYM